MKLYLYLSFAQLDVLRHAWLHAQAVLDGQDPFELNRPALSPTMTAVHISEIDYQQELKRQYAALPESMRAIVSFDYFRQQAARKRREIEQAMRKERQPRPPRLPDPKAYRALACCRFFATATNPMLWERYGDQYRGLALELDTSHPYFSAPRYKERPQLLRAVSYTDERPQADAEAQPFPALFHKGKLWAHEREWRLLRPQACADKTQAVAGRPRFLFKFPASCVTGVIVGCNAAEADREQLRKLLQYDMRYKKLGLKQLLLDPCRYQLHVRRCP